MKINKGQVRRLYNILFVPILIVSEWSFGIFDEIDELSYEFIEEIYSEDYFNWLESAGLEIEARAEASFERSMKDLAERFSKENPDWYKLPDENEPNPDYRKSMPTAIYENYLRGKKSDIANGTRFWSYLVDEDKTWIRPSLNWTLFVLSIPTLYLAGVVLIELAWRGCPWLANLVRLATSWAFRYVKGE